MKKIMLLGGSSQQVAAIEKAKELGCYTVLCDYLSDNPGRIVADKWYPLSTTDMEAVLKVAQDEQINAIVAYSSDPAAPTAAYVAKVMQLPGIPFETANAFCNKHLFRKYLRERGFNVPQCVELTRNSNATEIKDLRFPVIIKPTDSSGSKGVRVIHDSSQFFSALEFALKHSRNGILIAEEFIQRDHPDVIEAEVFVVNGEVKVWGLMNTIRDERLNPLLPAAYSYPLNISKNRVSLVKEEVSRLVKCSGVKYGAFNIEMIISSEEKLYFLDAGPRNGGNELPEFIGAIAGCDLVEATILSALGRYDELSALNLDGEENGFWGMVVLHSDKAGAFEKVIFDQKAARYLQRISYFKEPGDFVGPFKISRDAIGLAFFQFDSFSERNEIMNDFTGKHIKILMK